MKHKIVIKVNINCQTWKKKVLKAAAKLSGIDEMSVVDGETLSVVGEVDPVMVIERLRKRGKIAEIISVGPPKPPTPPEPPRPPPLPPHCIACQRVNVEFNPYPSPEICSIL